MKKILMSSFITIMTFSSSAVIAANDEITKSITIYGNSPQTWNYRPIYNGNNLQGHAVVTKSKIYDFEQGLNKIIVSDLPLKIDPSSIMIKNLSAGKSIIQQEFKSSVFNLGAVLEETIGQEVEVEQLAGDRTIYHRGTLVSTSPNLVLLEDERLRVLNNYSSIIIADREMESNSNTIKWDIYSEEDSDDVVDYSFKTDGMSWSASYNLFLEETGGDVFGKIESWSNIYNNTNLSARGTELKLVAGKVNSVRSNQPKMYAMARSAGMAMDSVEEAQSFQQESFSDYHIYRLSRAFNIEPFSSKKIKIYDDKERINLNRRYEVDANNGTNEVKSIIKIQNNQDSNLAMPLPAGKVTIFEKDSTGNFEKSGEANISHTAVNGEVKFEIGKVFDITAKKTRMNDQRNNARRNGSYEIKVELNNGKESDAKVFVKERIHNQNWKITNSSHTYKRLNSNQVEFPIDVKAKGKTTLTFKVEYSW